MSDVKAKDKELKKLTKEILAKQIQESRNAINYAQQNILVFTQQLQQQQGVLNYTEHLLAGFDIPSEPKPEEPKLEVK